MSTILDKLKLYEDYLDQPEAIRHHHTDEYVLRVKQLDENGNLSEWMVLLDADYDLNRCPDGAVEVEFHKEYLLTLPHAKDYGFGDTVLCLYSRADNIICTEPLTTRKLTDYTHISGVDMAKLQIRLPKRLVFPPF